jgi:hypothetical protein
LKKVTILCLLLLCAGLFIYQEKHVVFAEPKQIQQKPVIQEVQEKPALQGTILYISSGQLFFSHFSNEVLEAVAKLPIEKRPYLIVCHSSPDEVKAKLIKAGLEQEKYYTCQGEMPIDTVPSLVWIEDGILKKYACSMAVEKLDEMRYPILLAETELSRAENNAIRAAQSINGAIIEPGEEFSFYSYVGIPSTNRGYLPSRTLIETPEGPEWVADIGGGICKTATVLNFAVEKAGLEITERHSHTRKTSYASDGKDTAVARSSGWDYRFKNNRERPVKVVMKWDDNRLKTEIWELERM